MWRWTRQLRARVAMLLAGCSLFVLLVLFGLVVPPLQRNLQNAREQRLTDTVARALPRLRQDIGQAETGSVAFGAAKFAELVTGSHVQVWLDWGPTPQSPLFLPEADSHGGADEPPRFAVDAYRSGRTATRISDVGGQSRIEYAVPFRTPLGKTYLALFSTPSDAADSVSLIEQRLLIAAGVALALAVGVAFFAAEGLTRRVRRLQRAAEQLTAGEFSLPVVDDSPDEIGDLARSFDSMRIQLERLDRARKAFVANASHELRTPLTSLGGYVELLSEGGLDADTRREFLATMAEQVERLTKLASDLLDLSRLDAGELHVTADAVDLVEVALGSAREAQAVAARHGAQLGVSLGSPQVRALADEGRVRQVARALIDNALKHTPAGTTVTIVAGQDEDGRAVLAVVDDGPGIPAGAVDHLFERFYRAPGAAAQGSGLGLAIAHELALRMRGELAVESRPGRTAFTLVLPAAAPVREPAPLEL